VERVKDRQREDIMRELQGNSSPVSAK